MKNRLGSLDELPAVIDFWERAAKRVAHPMSVEELCDRFIAYRQSRPHNKRTLNELRYHVRAFAEACGNVKAHEILPAQLRRFLDSSSSDTMARNRYRALSVLFKFAALQRITVINPLTEIKRPSGNRSEPGILTPDEYERLLAAADAKFPTLLPYCAIAGFAGVRRAEMVAMYSGEETLRWGDILADKRLIVIRPEVAKTTRRESGDRRYPPIGDALMHWLEPYRQEVGAVVPYAESAFRRNFRGLCVEAGVSPGHNALRHSFASYWLARGGKEGVGRLAVIMGNSESVARRHYVETLEPGEGNRWFSIRRAVK